MEKLYNQSPAYELSREENIESNVPTDVSVNHEKIEENQKIILQTEIRSLTRKLNTANHLIEDQNKEKCVKEKEILELRSELEKSRKLHKEMVIISLLSAFLFNHKKGVNIETICSKINKAPIIPNTIPTVCAEEIEKIMRRHPTIFKEEFVGIEATQEKKWSYVPQETLEELRKSVS